MPATVHLQVQNPDGSSRAFALTEHDTFLLEACPPQASLRDLGSMNGTHVNGKKCGGREKGETPEQGATRQYPSIELKHGDRITVGQSSIEVRIEAAPDTPGVRQVNAALPEGDLSGLSPEAMQQLIFGKPGEAAFQLKGYHIERERELGRGGCGAVYLAKPQQSGAGKVAVKIMLSRAQADTRTVDQFKREMAVIAKLQHPHIVRFLDSGSDEGTFFFEEQIRQTRLRRLELRRHPLPPPHREIPLPLRWHTRSHRHHPQRKPRP